VAQDEVRQIGMIQRRRPHQRCLDFRPNPQRNAAFVLY
jgi:hypothetical protein